MLSSAALTFARIGNAREAAALASRALANVSKADAIGQASALLGNLAALEIKLGRPRRGAQLARRALRRVDGNTAEKLEATAAVAQQLSDAGQQKEARALLEKSMAEAAHVRYPWSERRTAALLGEALIRAGKVELGVAQIDGLSEHYGSRGRTQRRFARVLAELGAWDDAESIARSTEDLYQSDALRSVAVELSRHGLHERAHDVAMAIDSSRAQAEALCETLDLTDKAACRTGRELAEQAGDSAALAILAERLASHGDDAAAREIARSALQIAQSYEHHYLTHALGDLGRPFLAAGDAGAVREVDALLRKVDDKEYRADGRLRLALSLAEAGQGAKARAIVKEEAKVVDRLVGRHHAQACLFAAISMVLMRAGDETNAVRRARQALVALNDDGSSSSAYDRRLARERALTVLHEAHELEAALGRDEICFLEIARYADPDEAGLASLLASARAQPEGGLRALALAATATAFAKLGDRERANPLIFEALHAVRRGGRANVVGIIETAAGALAALDCGETLGRLCEAIKEIEGWWPQSPSRLR